MRADADEILLRTGGTLNILICDAGKFLDSPTSSSDCQALHQVRITMCPESKTKDGFELQFGTHHVGHFALFQAVKHALLSPATPECSSHVVLLTLAGHRLAPLNLSNYNLAKGYNPLVAYTYAKTANIHMSTEIERRYGTRNSHANSVHPGLVDTSIGRHLDPETAKAFAIIPDARQISKSPGQGAATIVLSAVAKELEGKGGKYLEDCEISGQAASADPMASPKGHAP